MLDRTHNVPPPEAAVALPGFRLRRLEMFNWGTFHHKVAVVEPNGRWTLIVGENGSGKSTAVDALRTLLVPTRLLQYNDASGDQKRRDRSRRSYVRGAWATSSQEDSAAARVEYLRKPGEQSILLAVFANEVTDVEVTIAQVLWEANESIHEVYAVARGARSISADLSDLGKTNELKKSLRTRGFEPFDRFPAYEETFRSRLGIPSKSALEVFNQAIGVKEIADVNSFIRKHMLEPSAAAEFINTHLKPHYKELDACYQAIQKAREQIAKLEPIAQCHRRIEEAQARKHELETLQQIAPLYYSDRQLALRRAEAEVLTREVDSLEAKQRELAREQAADTEQRVALEVALSSDTVGARIKSIDNELRLAMATKKEKDARYQDVRSVLGVIQKPLPFDTAEGFEAMLKAVLAAREQLDGERESARRKQAEAGVEQRQAVSKRSELAADLENLRKSRVLIPREFVSVRQLVCEETGISPEELPFAGELIEVKPEHREWTGAIERLMRSFGISLLVPERHYLTVTRLINQRQLGVRLQYHRVPAQSGSQRSASSSMDGDRVSGRLNFREDHPLSTWVKSEVARRFNHVCCPDMERLQSEQYGITREGLVRSGPTQHVKDDRRGVNDITNYVLGWSTEAKVRALGKAFETAEREAAEATQRAVASERAVKELDARIAAADAVLAIKDFSEVDVRSEQIKLERLQSELNELDTSSDQRKTLRKQLDDLLQRMKTRDDETRSLITRAGKIAERRDINDSAMSRLTALLAPHEQIDFSAHSQALSELQEEQALTLTNADELAASIGRKIQGRLNKQSGIIKEASDEMLPRMANFLRDYPEETADKKAEASYAPEFFALQKRLQEEDLPKHEQEFEKFLSLSLIGDVAMFSSKLDEHRKEIEDRIAEVNRALRKIQFAAGTHVQIVYRNKGSGDETAAFRSELRACLAGGLNPSAEDRLRVFNHIRELIGKFERDEAWTQRVTDARNWLEFGVQELSDADGREVNYYSASSGKSGGQKTRLAFTILASAITAQYGLIDADHQASTFRFVVIDEAFARTDEANSEQALKLFQSLGLQLLVVSPFDAKSRIVEDYVDTFHLALNPEGNSSHIRIASRLEYDAERDDRAA